MVARSARHRERTVSAMQPVTAALEVLGLAIEWQHAVPSPIGEALRAPDLVIQGMAADVDQAVDGRRTTPDLASRPGNAASGEMLLRLGFEAPVEIAIGEPEAGHEGNAKQWVPIGAPGLDEEDAGRRIGTEAVGKHAARRARADDDVIISPAASHHDHPQIVSAQAIQRTPDKSWLRRRRGMSSPQMSTTAGQTARTT